MPFEMSNLHMASAGLYGGICDTVVSRKVYTLVTTYSRREYGSVSVTSKELSM